MSDTRIELSHLPNCPLSSSNRLGWQLGQVDEYHLPPGELTLDSSQDIHLCFTLDNPFPLRQQIERNIHQDLSLPGDCSLISAGEPSHWLWQSPAHILVLQLDHKFIEDLNIDLHNSNRPVELSYHHVIRDTQLYHLALLLRAEIQGNGLGIRLYGESLLTALSIYLLKMHDTFAPISSADYSLTRPNLQQTIDYIHTNLSESLSLTDLSRVAGLSPTYFSQLFRQSIGVPPHQYIIRKRVEYAQHLLKTSDLSLSQVAVSSGFSDQSHLCRHMKRLLGVSPNQIRKS